MRNNSCSNMLSLKYLWLAIMVFVFMPYLFSQETLEGTVTDNGAEYMGGGAEPVVNALVELTDSADPGRYFSDYTDSEGKYSIKITETGVNSHSAKPEAFRLSQNFPNPFNPSTVISFALPCPAKISMDIHNISGRHVKTLFDGYHSERSGRVVWDATDDANQGVPAGVYIYSLRAEGFQISRKMLLMDGGHHPVPGSSHPGMRGHALNKSLSGQYRLRISGTGIETYEQQDLQITGSMVFNATVSRTVTDIDGNVYKTVKIGNQWWMAENLRVSKYRNGDEIPDVADASVWGGLDTGARCAYNNNPDNVDLCGYLYNWHAVNDSRNIAPEGWHVPADDEWKTLEKHLGMSQSQADAEGFRGKDEGGKLKEAGTTHWLTPNTGATNESGFTGIPNGSRYYYDGTFERQYSVALFWSSTEKDADRVWSRYLSYEISTVLRSFGNTKNGFSVRLVKD